MSDDKPKTDSPITSQIEEHIKESDPVKAAAVAVDNPAEIVVEVAEEAAQVEPVEEVIDEHTPPTNPILDGINNLLQKMGGLEDRMTNLEEHQKAHSTKAQPTTEPEPIKKEVKENAKAEEKSKRRGIRFKSRK